MRILHVIIGLNTGGAEIMTLARTRDGHFNLDSGLHLPLFFFHPDNRYAMLAWFVTFILLLTLFSLKKGRVECAD